jgi:hypothetical protein
MHLCFKFSALINISLLCSNWKLYMSTVSTWTETSIYVC